jgi:hypothetical protein
MGHLSPLVHKLYQDYGVKLYVVALEIAPDQAAAEKIVIETFVKIHQQQLVQLNEHPPPSYITFIKLLLQTAHEHLYSDQLKYNFKLKQFEHTPLLHKLICEQISLENYCKENHLSRREAAKEMRKELMSIRKVKSEKPTSQEHNKPIK